MLVEIGITYHSLVFYGESSLVMYEVNLSIDVDFIHQEGFHLNWKF